MIEVVSHENLQDMLSLGLSLTHTQNCPASEFPADPLSDWDCSSLIGSRSDLCISQCLPSQVMGAKCLKMHSASWIWLDLQESIRQSYMASQHCRESVSWRTEEHSFRGWNDGCKSDVKRFPYRSAMKQDKAPDRNVKFPDLVSHTALILSSVELGYLADVDSSLRNQACLSEHGNACLSNDLRHAVENP